MSHTEAAAVAVPDADADARRTKMAKDLGGFVDVARRGRLDATYLAS